MEFTCSTQWRTYGEFYGHTIESMLTVISLLRSCTQALQEPVLIRPVINLLRVHQGLTGKQLRMVKMDREARQDLVE